ncbi:hypothetical protein AYI70_g2119 [Smittium culicis]|uniref:Transcriptional regulatory protein RXT2 N-terminal domain-containing protein n=1 Tax=Smittium culicis TaxID=133412 RepID=A0A1R1YAH0_9FUNG|nr:hypothetical protein AYI70_g2119 [Smittium culicis]
MNDRKRPRLFPDYKRIDELLTPISDISDVLNIPIHKKRLENNFLEIISYELMRLIELEEKQTHPLRILLRKLLQDDINSETIDLDDETQKSIVKDIIKKINTTIMNSEELIHRFRVSREHIINTVNQKASLKRKIEKLCSNNVTKKNKKSD